MRFSAQAKKKHTSPLMATLFSFKGNIRACVFTDPMWGIPYNLFTPFFTVYMYSLGVKDIEIGILLSAGLIFQLLYTLLGGVITDKYGRRKTTFVGDLFSWTIPCVLWAFSQNFWWFFIAALANSANLITGNSWQCLWSEEAEPEQVIHIYNWVYIGGLLAVFFAPISSLLIQKFSLVPVMRGLFIFAVISMTLKFFILYYYSVETPQGLARMRETKDISVFRLLLGYKNVFFQIIRSRETVRVLVLVTLVSICQLISSNFFSLYITQNLSVAEKYLGYFPILRAAIMLVFFFGVQGRFRVFSNKTIMKIGLGVYAVNQVLLLKTPAGYLPLLVVYTALDACASALFLPRRDTLLLNSVDPAERARILSLISVIMLGVTSPFGYLAGWLSNMNRQLPFVLNLLLYALMALFL